MSTDDPFNVIITIIHKRQKYYYIPQILALLVVAPIAWVAMDREPPQWRVSGTLLHFDTTDNSILPRWPRQGEEVRPVWITTPRTRNCPGNIQYEIITGRNIWPTLQRAAISNAPLGQTTLVPDPVLIPELVPPGPATYRVTSFWYCTWFQRFFNYPVVQIGPDIHFTILPREKSDQSAPH